MAAPVRFEPFRPEDFRLYEPRNRSDETLNARRLEVRHRLQAVGDAAKAALAECGLALERRESLHHPFSVNHNRVVAQWTSIFRDAKQRKEFARVVGPELGKDVDPGNANAAFFVSINEDGLQLGLRLGEAAWYDARNLTNHFSKSENERRELVNLVRAVAGFQFRIHDWEKLYPSEKFTRDDMLEILKYYKTGEHRLSFYRSIQKSDPLACSANFFDISVSALRSLAPVYKFAAWSRDNNYLFQSGGGFA